MLNRIKPAVPGKQAHHFSVVREDTSATYSLPEPAARAVCSLISVREYRGAPYRRSMDCRSHSGRTSRQAHSTNPLQARNNPSTTPSSKCRSGSAATRQRSAACSTSSTVSAPTIARSLLARLTRRPGDTSFSGQGNPSAPSQRRMRLRMPIRELRSGGGVSSLMGSTDVYEEKFSESFTASVSWLCLTAPPRKRGGGRCVAANRMKRRHRPAGSKTPTHRPP